MNNKLCQALVENDKAILRELIDEELVALSPAAGNLDRTFEEIKTWLKNHDCITSVEIVSGVLRTEPPIKEFVIKIRNNLNKIEIRNIGITLFPDKLRLN